MEKTYWNARNLIEHLLRHRADLAPGGVFRAAALAGSADPRTALAHLVATGDLTRLRRGWYMLPDADEPVVRAVSAGGVLACVSALGWHGVWIPPGDMLHARTARPRDALGPGAHRCSVRSSLPAPRLAVDPALVALRCAVSCVQGDHLVAIIDSAMHCALVRPEDLGPCLRGTPGRPLRRARLSDVAESGTETLARLGLRRMGLPVRSQVVIGGVGRVDLLVGDRLVVEVDSVTHHASPQTYRADRQRDLRLTQLGYRVLRLTWQQVMYEWPDVEQAVAAIVARREHLWPRH